MKSGVLYGIWVAAWGIGRFGGKQFYIRCGAARNIKISRPKEEDGLWLEANNPSHSDYHGVLQKSKQHHGRPM